MRVASVPRSSARPWPRVGRAVLRPFVDLRTWSGAVHLLVGAPLGLGWLAVVTLGLTIGGATAALGVGLLVLLGTLVLNRGLGELERRLANALLDARIAAPRRSDRTARWPVRARRMVVDPRTWRSMAWLLLRAELAHAVRTVARGESLVLPEAVRAMVLDRAGPSAEQHRFGPALAGLTNRERDVLRLMAAGRNNSEIAAELFLGLQTVKTHVAAVLAKLGARDRTQAVIAALRGGFVG